MTATPDTPAGRRLVLDCKGHGPNEMCTLLCLVPKDRPEGPMNLDLDELERRVSAIIERLRSVK